MKSSCNVATLIERYFTERLMRQGNVSANTIASYRDTFRLLFTFAQARLCKPPSALTLDDLEAPFVGAFLTDLETERGAGVRTRNLRLTAIETLVAVEGHRWAIEDSFETAKNEFGLDHNESRSWHGWHRHVSLVMLAFAMMAVIRHRANPSPRKKTQRRAATTKAPTRRH